MAIHRRIRRRNRTRVVRSFARLVAGRRRSLRFESLETRRLLATAALPFWPVAVPEEPAEGEGENTEIQFRLKAVDLDGNPITQVPGGQQFFLDVTVQDVRPGAPNPGVYAAYLDVRYDVDLVSLIESQSNSLGFDIEFGPRYSNGGIADITTDGLIDEAGAFQAGFSPLGPDEFLLFRVRFETDGFSVVDDFFDGVDEDSQDVVLDVLANDAGRGGTARFTADPADRSPSRDVTFFDPPGAVSDDVMNFVGTSLEILEAGDPTIVSVSAPDKGGTARVSADGKFVLYTPLPDYFGQESFAYYLENGQSAIVTVDVAPVNDPPVAVDDSYRVELNEVLDVPSLDGVLGNDSDKEFDPLQAALVTPPDHGSVDLLPNGSFQYTPDTDYRGFDQFQYVARDATATSNVATVTIEVDPAHVGFRLEATDASGAVLSQLDAGDLFRVRGYVQDLRENTLTGIYAAYLDVLYSAERVEVVAAPENPLGIDITFFSGYQSGTSADAQASGLLENVGAFQESQQPNGSGEFLLFEVVMRARLGELEDDTFLNVQEDSSDVPLDVLDNDRINSGTAEFIGQPTNSSPEHDVVYFSPREKVADHKLTFADTSLQINATDLTITAVGPTSHNGIVTVAGDGLSLLYTPAANFFGTETFTYTVGGLLVAEAAVQVLPVNDPPEAHPDSYRVRENLPLQVDSSAGVLANDRDIDADLLVATLVDPPVHGQVVLNEDGSFTYTPPRNFSGPDQFTYLVNDGMLDSEPAIVTLEFDPPPVSIRLELTDVEGSEIQEVVDGQRLYVQVWVQDLRDETHPDRGIKAAYLDLIYDAASFQPILDSQLPLGFEMVVGADFQSPGAGDASLPGLIDEVGSTQLGATPLGDGEVLLLTIPFDVSVPRAADDFYELNKGSSDTPLDVLVNDLLLAWSADFVPEAADQSPDSDLLLFDSADAVDELDVRFADASATVRNQPSLFISQVDSPDQGGLAEISADGSRIIYTPAPGFSGDETFVYTVSNSAGRVARAEVTVSVVSSWQNVRDPLDVNDDGVVVPLDALLVINDLNANGARELLEPSTSPPYLDVNGDGFVSAIDALLVINYLNLIVGGGEAEGEAGGPGLLDDHGIEAADVEVAEPVDTLAAPEVEWQEGFRDLIAWLAQRFTRR